MATRTIANGGGDWNTPGTWVEGAVPTNLDDVVATATSGNLTLTSSGLCRSLDFTNYVGTFSPSTGVTLRVNGAAGVSVPCKFVAGMTFTPSGTFTLRFDVVNTGTVLLTSAAKVPINVFIGSGATTGGVILQDALTLTTTLTLISGTLDTNNKAVSLQHFDGSTGGSNARTLTLGSSTLTFTGSGGWDAATSTNFTLNAGTSTIALFNASQSFHGGGLTYYNLTYTFGNTTLTIDGTNTFNNVTMTGGSNTGNVLSLSNDQVVTGTLTVTSFTVNRRIIVQSDTVGTSRQITAGAVSFSDVDFMDIAGAGGAAPFAGTRLGNAGGNSGITFTVKNVYVVGVTTAKTMSTASFALSSGGGGASANFPLPQDTLFIDGNSGTNTLTIDQPRMPAIDASAANSITVTSSVSPSVYGSLDFRGCVNAAFAGTNGITWRARGSTTIRHGGKLRLPGSLALTAPGGTLQLLDDLLAGGQLSFNNGTFDANNKNVTCFGIVASSGGGTRTVNTGTGTWTLTGTGSVASITTTAGQLTWNNQGAKWLVTDTSTATKTVNLGNAAVVLVRFETLEIPPGHGDSGAIIPSGTLAQIGTLRVYAPNTISLAASLVYDTVETHGYPGNLVTFNSTSPGTRRNINQRSAVTNTWTSDYIAIQDVAHVLSAGQSPWYLGANSTDLGNNATIGTTMLLAKGERLVPARAVAGARSVGTEAAHDHVAY